jgi:predicted DsbA family dithiol-disulfide isomerase
MALESSHVVADVVEVTEFPHLAQRYAIRGVPKTVINETVEFIGAVPESQFAEHVQRASSPAASGS